MKKATKLNRTDFTKEMWGFKKNEIFSEINELIFVSKLGDEKVCAKRCDELAHKYKTKSEHFKKCTLSNNATDIEELAETLTASLYGRKPR